jgi:hypothetical protein
MAKPRNNHSNTMYLADLMCGMEQALECIAEDTRTPCYSHSLAGFHDCSDYMWRCLVVLKSNVLVLESNVVVVLESNVVVT